MPNLVEMQKHAEFGDQTFAFQWVFSLHLRLKRTFFFIHKSAFLMNRMTLQCVYESHNAFTAIQNMGYYKKTWVGHSYLAA
jgi:hypothetical protein